MHLILSCLVRQTKINESNSNCLSNEKLCSARLKLFSKFLICSWIHFRAKFFSNAFSYSSFTPKKPLRFILIAEYYFEAIFIQTAFFWSDKPKTIDDCCLNQNKFIKKINAFLPEQIFPFIEFSDWNNTLTTQGKDLLSSSLTL